jgi:hypothetical protein
LGGCRRDYCTTDREDFSCDVVVVPKDTHAPY